MSNTKEDKDYWYKQGHQDAAAGDNKLLGGPWGKLFEEDKDFKEREDIYKKGKENYKDQKP